MADSAEIVEPTSPTSGAAGPGGSARSAGPHRPAAAGASIRPDSLTKRYPEANDPALVEAARGIGMSPLLTMFRVKLPLAVPLILAGMRPALVRNVGSATPATVGVGRGPWDLVSSGITSQRLPVLVLGSVLTVTMALIMDRSVTLIELLLRPRSLEVD